MNRSRLIALKRRTSQYCLQSSLLSNIWDPGSLNCSRGLCLLPGLKEVIAIRSYKEHWVDVLIQWLRFPKSNRSGTEYWNRWLGYWTGLGFVYKNCSDPWLPIGESLQVADNTTVKMLKLRIWNWVTMVFPRVWLPEICSSNPRVEPLSNLYEAIFLNIFPMITADIIGKRVAIWWHG